MRTNLTNPASPGKKMGARTDDGFVDTVNTAPTKDGEV